MEKKYKITILPLFEQDMQGAIQYISKVLDNPSAAERLLDKTYSEIKKRLKNPLAFAPYDDGKKRKDKYYRILVNNFSVFYVVLDDVMEVRRFIYNRRDLKKII